MDDRHWGFGGDARYPAIDKLVQHQIANHKNSEPTETCEGSPELGRGKVNVWHPLIMPKRFFTAMSALDVLGVLAADPQCLKERLVNLS
jgi:hypothetical protein